MISNSEMQIMSLQTNQDVCSQTYFHTSTSSTINAGHTERHRQEPEPGGMRIVEHMT